MHYIKGAKSLYNKKIRMQAEKLHPGEDSRSVDFRETVKMLKEKYTFEDYCMEQNMWIFPMRDPEIFNHSSNSAKCPDSEEETPLDKQFLEFFNSTTPETDLSVISAGLERFYAEYSRYYREKSKSKPAEFEDKRVCKGK